MAVTLAISFIFCALVVRLFILQIIKGPSLQLRATDQWTRDLKITAPRGKVIDRTGSALAVSYTTYNVYVRSREVSETSVVANILSKELGLTFEKVYEKIKNNKSSEVLIKMQVEGEVAEQIYNHSLKGVYLVENANRYYPYGNLLSQIMGFISVDNEGQSGLEAYYNDYLKGENGFSYVQSDLQGKEIGGSLRYYVPATAGADLTLTVDSKMQLILEHTLEKIMEEQQAKSVSGVIMDAQSGEILSISSKPSFDLNDVPRDDLTSLFEQSKVKVVTDVYEPGSTFKILTVAAALEEGLTNLNDRFYCPGYRMIDGIKIKCWRTIGHGSQTLSEAFANSCNCCFMDLALRLGTEKFYSYMHKFGLGQKTGIDVSGEASGILMARNLVKKVDLARMGFGHAIALTPIQLCCAVSCIVNGGTFNSPHIVSLNGENEGLNLNFKRTGNIVSAQTSSTVNALLEFAENKTGKYTFVEGYNVGGKTGTAQKYKAGGGIDQGKYISSFIGTYPADKPKYLVFVMVDEPGAGAYYGSIVAAPYGKEIFSGMFDYLDEKKQNENVTSEFVQMPDVEGKSLAECASLLKTLGLSYELDGEGAVIVKQLPPAGTSVQKGQSVLLIT
ncbi:MAG: PASTA domain-containing protein [Clostridia bacterium]|nr:PASTA domain-containing protein [Clostridia bacterium]